MGNSRIRSIKINEKFFSFLFEQQFSLHSKTPTNCKVDKIFWVKTQKLKTMVDHRIHDQQERKYTSWFSRVSQFQILFLYIYIYMWEFISISWKTNTTALAVSGLHRKRINRMIMSDYGVCSFSDPPFQTKAGTNSGQINPLLAALLGFISGAWN